MTSCPQSTAIAVELRAFAARAGRDRALATTVHVGKPGGEHVSMVHRPEHDHGLRTDLVVRALDGLTDTHAACAWLTRAGELHRTDADAVWLAAARAGFACHGLPLPHFYVVSRRGWLDLVSGEQRVWRRLRAR